MALNGSFKTSSYYSSSKDDYISLRFEWTATQNIENNTSTINWSLKGDRNASGYVMAGFFKVVIDGANVYETAKSERIELRKDTLVASGSKTLTHNAQGARSFSVSVEGAIYENSRNVSGSTTFTLNDIPRKATIVTVPVSFDDETGNPTITYSNPLGTKVDKLQAYISLSGSDDDIAYRDIPKTGTSYTFELTEAEKNTLRNATTTSTSRQVLFFVRTIIANNTFWSNKSSTFNVVNANPVLNPVAVDTSATALSLTGNNKTIIKGYNSVKVSANATAQKGATITSYLITNGSNSLDSAEGLFNYTDNPVFKIRATDSRGLITEETITLSMIEYVNLTCNLTVDVAIVGETTVNMTVAIQGNYFNGSFGAASNTIAVFYRIKTNSGAFSNWEEVDAVVRKSGNTYRTGFELANRDYGNSYTIEAMAVDKVFYGGVTSTAVTVSAKPVFDWSGADFNFNVPVYINNVELDYIVDSGSNNGWYYRKWNSGKAECWKTLAHTTAISQQWGSMYVGTATTRQEYPFHFMDKPVETVTLQSGYYAAWLYPMGNVDGVNGAHSSACYNVCRPSTADSNTYYFSYYVYGYWK